ncbi:BolA-like protein 1 [Mayamaea pseudoterrestris]|nr:BolA-like protein 1 [Mayamaea pseudoterrestris]
MRPIHISILSLILIVAPISSWMTSRPTTYRTSRTTILSSSSSSSTSSTNIESLGLTPELAKLTTAFSSIGDDKLRYKQLLYMANQLAPMDDSLKTPNNIVPGCLSTVYIHATKRDDGSIHFQGDSDGLLTKGLVALLVRGLSGNGAQNIQKVDPQFIQLAGISASLTPGRNNGFLNMLKVMKQQAKSLEELQSSSDQNEGAATSESDTSTTSSSNGGTKYDAIIQALQILQPTKIDLIDNSHQHAGHAGNDMDGESHFDLYIVADAFDGLNLVKRHKLVYTVLGELMPKIHALQIRAQTPSEASK